MNMPTVTIKGCYDVRPCEPTWIGTMALSEWDQTDCVTHIPIIYFYRPSNTWLSPPSAIADTLKRSLSRVLVPFYLLAGRLQWIGHGRLQLQCNAMGARFIEAECESNMDDLEVGNSSSLSYQPDSLFPFIDYSLPIHELPLLLVQLTRFKCGGISIGIAGSHAVADGPAGVHFISEWARLARDEPLETPPFFDRSVFRAGEPPLASPPPSVDDCLEYKNLPLLLGQLDNLEERKKKFTRAMLNITKSQMEHLRKTANDSWTGKDNKPLARGYTRFETVCGHIWRIACKARRLKMEQPTALVICVDLRNHMKAKLPREYFGNANLNVIARSVVGDLMSKPLGFAASKVREAIEKVTYEYVRSSIEFLKNEKDLTRFQDINKEEGLFYGNPNIELVSWLTLPMHGCDFGWGKEEFMGLGSHGTEGSSLLISSPKGDGSILIAMCLQESHMDAFKKHLYEDITTHTQSQIGLPAAL